MSNKGNIYVVSGPSGVGKGTVVKRVVESDDRIALSVSATTREPRAGEIDKVHYFFISREEFQNMVDEDGFMEHAEYCGNCYGTPKAAVFEKIEQGCDVILEIEVQGGIQIMEKFPQAYGVFVFPPGYKELEQRLRGRASEPDEVIHRRLNVAREEIKQSYRYDYFVVNDTVEQAAQSIIDIIEKNRQ